MKAYKITAAGRVRYAGTNALAREARQSLVDKFGVKKKDAVIEDVEIPTAKPDLLAWINELQIEHEGSTDGTTPSE